MTVSTTTADMPPDTLEIVAPTAEDLVHERLESHPWKRIDDLASYLTTNFEPIKLPLRHVFTPGLYTREIFMPAGSKVVSRIHLTEHPYFILKGVVSVFEDERGWVTYHAPFWGITKPGTRRVLYIHEDTVWVTTHVTDKTDPDEILRDITFCEGVHEILGPASASAPAEHPPLTPLASIPPLPQLPE